MSVTEGEIGTFIVDGEQIGGFLAWEARVDLTTMTRPRTLLAARAVWLFKDMPDEGLEAVLYRRVGGKLEVVNKLPVSVTSFPGDIPDDTLVQRSVEMVSERPTSE